MKSVIKLMILLGAMAGLSACTIVAPRAGYAGPYYEPHHYRPPPPPSYWYGRPYRRWD